MLISRIIPRDKDQKPGKDYYFPIIFIQLITLVYIFFFFTKMEGYTQDISQSFQVNQFQGRMVIALILQFSLILIERYLYVIKTSQALKEEDYEASLQRSQSLIEASVSVKQPNPKKDEYVDDSIKTLMDGVEHAKHLIKAQVDHNKEGTDVKAQEITGDDDVFN